MSKNKGSLQKVQEVLQSKIAPVASRISAQRHVSAIKDGLMFTVPLTIIGGFSLIVAQPPVDPKIIKPTNFFNSFLLAWKAWATTNAGTLMILYNMTIGLIGLFAVVAIAYNLAKSYDLNPLSESISALLTFLVICAPAEAVDKTKPAALFLSTGYLDAKGLFTAIIIGLLTVEISRFLLKNNIKIKMPDSVPPMVAAPFESLIPAIVNVLLFLFINLILVSLTGMNIPKAVMKIFAPAIKAVDSLGAMILVAFIINILWFFGIHGGAVVNSVIAPFVTLNFAENAQALASGKPLPHIFAGNFFGTFLNIGGSGAALGMAIAMLIVAKSAQLKSISKIGIVPVLFNISEPFVFGTPIIMNTHIFIPWLAIPIINAIITYTAITLGLVGKIYVGLPFTTPGLIGAFLGTMDWRAIILWLILISIDVILYMPFVKSYDNALSKKEAKVQD